MDPLKGSVGDLALFGGRPAFENALHVGRPNTGNRDKFVERVDDILNRKWLTNGGEYVKEFEQRIAEFVGADHCVAMCNGTVALEIAIRALGMTGEVIVPSFTFIGTAHALQWQEIKPVFCDINRQTYTLAPDKVERMITPRTSGIIGVNVFGRACDIDALSEIAERYELKLVFDSAHALGCSYKGRMIGGFGNAEVFSFHATKFLNSLEGGAVVTNNTELAQQIRSMKNFGFTDYDTTAYVGTNAKMNEVCAAMGLTNLKSIDDFIAINRCHYRQYADELVGIEGLNLLSYNEEERCNYQYVVLEIDKLKTIVTRDQLMEILHKENVLARRYFNPGCHRMEPYRTHFPQAGLLLPETEKLASRVLCMPTGTGVSEGQIAVICRMVRLVIENGVEIAARFDWEHSAGSVERAIVNA